MTGRFSNAVAFPLELDCNRARVTGISPPRANRPRNETTGCICLMGSIPRIRTLIPKPSGRSILVALVVLAFVTKVLLALFTLGSFDTLTWQRDLQLIHAHGVPALYRDGISYFSPEGRLLIEQPFIHPPFIIHALHAWESLANATQLPLQFWIRFSCALADVASLMLLGGILRHTDAERVLERLCFVAICPASILISGFHGNTDPIMMTFVLASIYFLESRRLPWAAGVSLGMALNFKLAALMFTPALLLYTPGIRRKFTLGGAAGVTFLAGSIPYLAQEPRLILTRIMEYKSQFGPWGIGRLCASLVHDGGLGVVCDAYSTQGRVVVMLLITTAAIWAALRKNKPSLLLQCGLAAFIFLALTPGFGVQYLAWLIPFTALVSRWPAVLYHIVSGAFLLAYYNRVMHAWPAYLANTFDQPAWYGHVIYLGLLCWIAVCAVACLLASRLSQNEETGNSMGGTTSSRSQP